MSGVGGFCVGRAAPAGALRIGSMRAALCSPPSGLISPGKGNETAIAAMPAIVERHPNTLYLIAGQTHPEVARRHGEEYRISLERLTNELDLGDHVLFDDRFLGTGDLSAMLAATSICRTPYRSREQTVSGALTFALVVAVNGLLGYPMRLDRARRTAHTVGHQLTWAQVGRQTAEVLREAIVGAPTVRRPAPTTVPRARTSHLLTQARWHLGVALGRP